MLEVLRSPLCLTKACMSSRRTGSRPRRFGRRIEPRARPKPSSAPSKDVAPLFRVDDLEDFVRPPLPGKVHPPAEMDEGVTTLDDEQRLVPRHANDAGAVEFAVDPEGADAAADLASDLGAQYLEGATFAEDMSERVHEHWEGSPETPLVIQEEEGPA